MIPIEPQYREEIRELSERMARIANEKGQVVYALFNECEIVARPGDSALEVEWSYWDHGQHDRDAAIRGFGRPYSLNDLERIREICGMPYLEFELANLARKVAESELLARHRAIKDSTR